MIFGFLGSKKSKGFHELLAEYLLHQQVVGHIAKAQSLQKLGRGQEANMLLRETERKIVAQIQAHPRDKQGHLLLAMFYTETGVVDLAEKTIERLLGNREFQLSEDERFVLSAEMQKIKRQRPIDERRKGGPEGFTTIYCCQHCGRLHNFVSMPCPHCDWCPETIDQTARSLILSNAHFKVPALLLLSREMEKGRPANDVVPNLAQDARTYVASGERKEAVTKVLSLLNENKRKHHRSLPQVRACNNCGHRILLSSAEKCDKCDSTTDWPDAVRTLVCMDNLLWLFEQRAEPAATESLSELVCVLVSMTNNLLRKQETPQSDVRRYALDLLGKAGAIADLGKGAIIETKNPQQLKIYLVKDSMREDSESFGLFWYKELEYFAQKMVNGVEA
ncbi:MAG: hypothetical protein AB7E73_14010 [Burkholderiales bacterium]